MATFVLVHGACFGGWAWKRVTPLLRAQGHDVHTVTLTGLGERSHLLSPEIGLETHVDDVCNLLEFEDIQQAVMVGHSYAGMVVGSVSHRMPERLSQLIYLDAFVPEHGKSMLDLQVDRFRQFILERARTGGDGWKLPALDPNGETLGLSDPNDVAWVRAKLTAHPLRTMSDPANLGRIGAGNVPQCYIYCTGNPADGSFPRIAKQVKASRYMRYAEIDAPHAAMIASPAAVAGKLLDVLG